MVENSSECNTYNTASVKTQEGILRGFKGIPLTIIINLTWFMVCLCIHMVWRNLVSFLRKRGRNIPPVEDEAGNAESNLRTFDYFWTSDAIYQKRAGLDALLYMKSMRFSVLHLVTLIPIFIAGLLANSRDGKIASFDSMSLSGIDLGINRNNILLGVSHVITYVFYLLVTALRYRYVDLIYRKCVKRSRQFDLVILLSGAFKQTNVEIQSALEKYLCDKKLSVNINWCYVVQRLAKLTTLEISRSRSQVYLQYSQREREVTGSDPVYWKCACIGCLHSPCLPSRNAIEVYKEQVHDLDDKIVKETSRLEFLLKALVDLNESSSSGLAIICLRCQTEDLKQLVNGLNLRQLLIEKGITSMLKESDSVRTPFKETKLISHPSELLWSNLMTPQNKTHCRLFNLFLVRVVIFAIALLLTSPMYFFYAFNYYSMINKVDEQFVPILFNWVPALTLIASTALVPLLVTYSENMIKHFTYNEREKRGIFVLFIFLLITVVIFPSFGMAGLPIAVAHFIELFNAKSINLQNILATLKFRCVFAPDTSALFVNYVITGSLLTVGMEMLQVGRWFLFFFWRIFTVHSNSEAEVFAKYEYYPFQFREKYAMTMLVQTIILAFAPINAVIIPFGFGYFFSMYLLHKYMLLRIFPAPRSLSANDESWCFMAEHVGDKRVGHIDWFVTSTHLSLFGICGLAVNIGVFYIIYSASDHIKFPVIVFGILTLLVLIISAVMIWFSKRHFKGFIWRDIDEEQISNLSFVSSDVWNPSKEFGDEFEPELDVLEADMPSYMPPILRRLNLTPKMTDVE